MKILSFKKLKTLTRVKIQKGWFKKETQIWHVEENIARPLNPNHSDRRVKAKLEALASKGNKG